MQTTEEKKCQPELTNKSAMGGNGDDFGETRRWKCDGGDKMISKKVKLD